MLFSRERGLNRHTEAMVRSIAWLEMMLGKAQPTIIFVTLNLIQGLSMLIIDCATSAQ